MSQKKLSMSSFERTMMLEAQEKTDYTIAVFLSYIIMLIPLITRTHLANHFSPIVTGSIMDSGIKGDVFTYYKLIFLIFASFALLLFMLYKMTSGEYRLASLYSNAPLATLFVLFGLSGLMADYKTISIFGQYNRHDGVLAYLCYFLLFFVASHILYTKEIGSKILKGLYIVIGVNALLNVLYFYGYDVLTIGLIHGILFPADLPPGAINAGAHLDSTINNPNYVSGFAGVFTLLFMTHAALSKELRDRIVSVLIACLSFAMLLSSMSTSGFFTFVVMLPIVFVLLFRSVNIRNSFITVTVTFSLFSGIFYTFYQHNPNVWNESIGFFIGKAEKKLAFEPFIPIVEENKAFAAEKPASVKEVDEFQLPALGWGAGTGRIYIWERTWQLIERNPLFGYGMDTLAYYFPHDDPNKASSLNDPNIIVDKPHNFYIGIAFGAGIPALVAFLYLCIRHLWAHRLLFQLRTDSPQRALMLSLFVAWLAYLVQALFNDSVIGVSVVFWLLFGMGVSLVNQEWSQKEQGGITK